MNSQVEPRPDIPEDIPSKDQYSGSVYQRIRQIVEDKNNK